MGHGAVDASLTARWIWQVLAGLEQVHRLNVVHRDVKPDNVLLARTADGEVAKLTDFGIAKVLDTSGDFGVDVRTGTGMTVGTPEYMAPEQWSGDPVDARADL